MTIEGITALDYSINPVSFKGIGNGTITDLDGDGNRDLDGLEYEAVADEILIPRFLGQGGTYNSELILHRPDRRRRVHDDRQLPGSTTTTKKPSRRSTRSVAGIASASATINGVFTEASSTHEQRAGRDRRRDDARVRLVPRLRRHGLLDRRADPRPGDLRGARRAHRRRTARPTCPSSRSPCRPTVRSCRTASSATAIRSRSTATTSDISGLTSRKRASARPEAAG